MQIVNGSVNIVFWVDEDIRVECQVKVYWVDSQEVVCIVFFQYIECEVKGNKFFVCIEKKMMKINVMFYVFQKEYDKIRVKLFNGLIRGEYLYVKEFLVKMINGVLLFFYLMVEKVLVEMVNG